MDSELTLDSHISAICKSCYYHLRSLRHIRRSLTQDMAVSVAVAIVQSRLDYRNSLLYDISTFNISKIQRVQNLVARLALNVWHSPSHALISKLHWLPVESCAFTHYIQNFFTHLQIIEWPSAGIPELSDQSLYTCSFT